MPHTHNGIGTHYYGKKNLATRLGVCQFCHREGSLASYDTGLYFVILFIPIIPLGKKRINDYCPSCRRHLVMKLADWEAAKQKDITAALEKYRTKPTPEAAIEAHARLLRFHQYQEAESFREVIGKTFADNAPVQAQLGAALEYLRQYAVAEPYFKRAYALQPELPAARAGVATMHLRAGRLDEARPLLDFLEKPDAAKQYSMAPLELLGDGYQKIGRHREALDAYTVLLAALPTLGQSKAFRKKVARSEKALGQQKTILPKKIFSWKNLFQRDTTVRQGRALSSKATFLIIGISLALFMIVMLISNEFVRRHRTLYVVADFTKPVQIEVKGVETVTFTKGMREISLPEGQYHAHVSGPVTEDIDFEVRASYSDRWGDHPVWLLNAGGSAMLELQTAIYQRDPLPVKYEYHFGKSFEYFPQITNPFQDLPKTVQVDAGSSRTLESLDLIRVKASALFSYLIGKNQFDQALLLAESHLRAHPEDNELRSLYDRLALRQKKD